MCGIAGVLELDSQRTPNAGLLKAMGEVLRHRGPDQGGVFVAPGVGLSHRRLSIIDLAAGRQPLPNEDGTVIAVFNGEIYNFRDLAKVLEGEGHVFRTRCDTEVIVHAWEEWGEGCLSRFRGMFAFGIWDAHRSMLFLARDRLGIKPLFYGVVPSERFIFGSELKALLVDPHLPRRLDPRAVEDYFALGYIPAPHSILSAVKKLPAGHYLCVSARDIDRTPTEYWDVPATHRREFDEEEVAVELAQRIREAVGLRLVSDVPLGAFLSGGVDSSSVVASMAQLVGEPVKTFSIGFGEKGFDETRYADQVARRYRTDHTVEQVDPGAFDLIESLIGCYDEPFADSSAIPTWRVSSLAKKRVTVALSGDGGDEILAGYRHYRWLLDWDRTRRLIPGGATRYLVRNLGKWYPPLAWAPRLFRLKFFLQALGMRLSEAHAHSISILKAEDRMALYSDSMRSSLQGYRVSELFEGYFAKTSSEDLLSRVQYVDLKTYLPGDILTKVDRVSMAQSLEVRVPLLDHELVEWVSGLDPNLKLKGREGKYILKRAMIPYLPRDIMYRKKMGFTVPMNEWLRGPLKSSIERLSREPLLGDSGLFDMARIDRIVRGHLQGHRNVGAVIWSLMMFNSFLNKTLSCRPNASANWVDR